MSDEPRRCEHCNQPLPADSKSSWCQEGWRLYQEAEAKLEASPTSALLVYGSFDVPGTNLNFLLIQTSRKFKAPKLRAAINHLLRTLLQTKKAPYWNWEGEHVTPPWSKREWDLNITRDVRYIWDGEELKKFEEKTEA